MTKNYKANFNSAWKLSHCLQILTVESVALKDRKVPFMKEVSCFFHGTIMKLSKTWLLWAETYFLLFWRLHQGAGRLIVWHQLAFWIRDGLLSSILKGARRLFRSFIWALIQKLTLLQPLHQGPRCLRPFCQRSTSQQVEWRGARTTALYHNRSKYNRWSFFMDIFHMV